MSFGKMPIANGFLKKEKFKKSISLKWKLDFQQSISISIE